MPTYTESLPQVVEPIKVTKITDLVAALPDTLPCAINVWIAGKIARFGVSAGTLLFLCESAEFPSVEMRDFFGKIGDALGILATITPEWRNEQYEAIRLYNEGRLIVDKTTMTYKELPSPVKTAPIITADEVAAKLPETIEWTNTLYLTGGIVRNGYSANDVDFIVFDVTDRNVLTAMRIFFTQTLGWRTDVGTAVMPEREPVYLFKTYEGGRRCQ